MDDPPHEVPVAASDASFAKGNIYGSGGGQGLVELNFRVFRVTS